MVYAYLKPLHCWIIGNVERKYLDIFPFIVCYKLYKLFQVMCPVGISLFLFKILYMAWVPFLF